MKTTHFLFLAWQWWARLRGPERRYPMGKGAPGTMCKGSCQPSLVIKTLHTHTSSRQCCVFQSSLLTRGRNALILQLREDTSLGAKEAFILLGLKWTKREKTRKQTLVLQTSRRRLVALQNPSHNISAEKYSYNGPKQRPRSLTEHERRAC